MASFIDTLLGNDNTGTEAARQQYEREQEAIRQQVAAGGQAQAGYEGISQQYNPYIQSGQNALQMLMSGAGLSGGAGNQAYTQAFQNLPGYQSGLESGTNAALRAANASGHSLGGGRTLKALQQHGIKYDREAEQDYWNRLMGLNTQGLGATQAKVGTQGTGIGANLGAQSSAYGRQFQSAATEPLGMIADRTAQNQAWSGVLGLGGAALGGWAGGGFKTPSFGSPQLPGSGPYPKFG